MSAATITRPDKTFNALIAADALRFPAWCPRCLGKGRVPAYRGYGNVPCPRCTRPVTR